MRPIRFIPAGIDLPFIPLRKVFAIFSTVLVVASVVCTIVFGLNFGIDFSGGTLIEIRTEQPADLSQLRSDLGTLGLGDVSIQEFGGDREVLIVVQQQQDLGEDQKEVIEKVKSVLGDSVEYRRIEFVGPSVGEELKEDGIIAVVLALGAILLYVTFRFEWHFGVGAVVALLHDVLATVGLFAVTQMEFNLATVAAVLTIAGYSINDTVVVFDRVRENLRRYKSMSMPELFNRSINETLSRTTITSFTTVLALLALLIFGGEGIRGFPLAMIWGIVIGTYSSICIAVPILLWSGLKTDGPGSAPASSSGDERSVTGPTTGA